MWDRKMEKRQTGTIPIFLSAIFLSKSGQGMRCFIRPPLQSATAWKYPCQMCPDLKHIFQLRDTLCKKRLPHCIERRKIFIE